MVVISFVTMLTGGALTATTESAAMFETAKRNHCIPNGAHSCPLPDTTPVCPLCVCAMADTAQPVEIETTFQIFEFAFPEDAQSIPDPYVSEIFHPPRLENSIRRS